jgi:hypothetical protein
LFTPTNIITDEDFDNYLVEYLPHFSDSDLTVLKVLYPYTHDSNSSIFDYDTMGLGEPNANSISDWGNGQQQRAFVCKLTALVLERKLTSLGRTC